MRICLVLEGCYPYVFGGVSTWMHQYINQMQEHEFVLWVIGANAEKRGKFVYELPENVVEVHEVFLDDALQVKEKGKMSHIFSEKELESLSELMQMRRPDWETLFSLYHDKHLNPMAFLKSETFLDLLIKICKEQYPYIAFADAFHTMRSMLLPVLYLMGSARGGCVSCHMYRVRRTSGLSGRLCAQKGCSSYRTWNLYTGKRGGDHPCQVGGSIL